MTRFHSDQVGDLVERFNVHLHDPRKEEPLDLETQRKFHLCQHDILLQDCAPCLQPRLLAFYEVGTTDELIVAQNKQIERLQEKLRAYQPTNEQVIGRKSREG